MMMLSGIEMISATCIVAFNITDGPRNGRTELTVVIRPNGRGLVIALFAYRLQFQVEICSPGYSGFT